MNIIPPKNPIDALSDDYTIIQANNELELVNAKIVSITNESLRPDLSNLPESLRKLKEDLPVFKESQESRITTLNQSVFAQQIDKSATRKKVILFFKVVIVVAVIALAVFALIVAAPYLPIIIPFISLFSLTINAGIISALIASIITSAIIVSKLSKNTKQKPQNELERPRPISEDKAKMTEAGKELFQYLINIKKYQTYLTDFYRNNIFPNNEENKEWREKFDLAKKNLEEKWAFVNNYYMALQTIIDIY